MHHNVTDFSDQFLILNMAACRLMQAQPPTSLDLQILQPYQPTNLILQLYLPSKLMQQTHLTVLVCS